MIILTIVIAVMIVTGVASVIAVTTVTIGNTMTAVMIMIEVSQ